MANEEKRRLQNTAKWRVFRLFQFKNMTLIAGLNFMIFIGLIFLISRFFQNDFSLSYKINKLKINTLMKLIWLTFRRH
ncbi:hypothetical protein FRN28_15005 [Vibrio vulnificus]|nr:hypothetical protein [Vibrio vulnificus]